MQAVLTLSLAAGFGLLCFAIGWYSGIGHVCRSIEKGLS